MRRAEFNHVIAAAANIVEVDEFVVIGSQAILGAHPDSPPGLLESMEVLGGPSDSGGHPAACRF